MSDYNNNVNGLNDELNSTSSYDAVNSDYKSEADNDTSKQYSENSYEWNSDKTERTTDSEYHYSYVNGNNHNAPHNPNNYEIIKILCETTNINTHKQQLFKIQSNIYLLYSLLCIS